jgi:hypothetical protein
MKVRYVNQQDDTDPMNGVEIAESALLTELLDRRRNNPPFFGRFSGDNGFELMIGFGGDFGCVQFSRSDGEPPYLMAVPPCPHMTSGDVEFLTADTPTPVPARNILSFDELKQVALHFVQTGGRSEAVSWKAI